MSNNTTKRKAADGSQVEQQPDQQVVLLQALLVTIQKIDETTQALLTSTQEIATALRTVTQEKEEREQEVQAQTSKNEEGGKDAAPLPSFYRGQWVGVEPQPIILRKHRARQEPQAQPEEREVHS